MWHFFFDGHFALIKIQTTWPIFWTPLRIVPPQQWRERANFLAHHPTGKQCRRRPRAKRPMYVISALKGDSAQSRSDQSRLPPWLMGGGVGLLIICVTNTPIGSWIYVCGNRQVTTSVFHRGPIKDLKKESVFWQVVTKVDHTTIHPPAIVICESVRFQVLGLNYEFLMNALDMYMLWQSAWHLWKVISLGKW